MRHLFLAGCIALTSPAWGATISIDKDGDGKVPVIAVAGEIVDADYQRFRNAVDQIPRSVDRVFVVLAGPGGEFATGMAIAAIIAANHFETVVLSNMECASMCATIWVAGAKRWMTATSKIGFHDVYMDGKNGEPVVVGDGNAMVGAFYASVLNLNIDAIRFLTAARPESMNYLTLDNAQKLGIAVSLFDDHLADKAPVVAQDDPPAVTQPAPQPAVAAQPAPLKSAISHYEFICIPVNDPTDAIHVTVEFDTSDNWKMKRYDVVHVIGSGRYDRFKQYGNVVRSQHGYNWTWFGHRWGHDDETMSGELYWVGHDSGTWKYQEFHWRGDVRDFVMESICARRGIANG